jgi:hypothetical protein
MAIVDDAVDAPRCPVLGGDPPHELAEESLALVGASDLVIGLSLVIANRELSFVRRSRSAPAHRLVISPGGTDPG